MTTTIHSLSNHSSVRLRMFFYVPVANNFGNLTIVVNGINTTHIVDSSFTTFLKPNGDYYLYTTPEIPHKGAMLTLSLFSFGSNGESYNFGIK